MAPGEEGGAPRPARSWGGAWGWGRWVVVVLLVVWAFILGVLVGQGVLGNQEQVASVRAMLVGLPLVGAWFEQTAPAPASNPAAEATAGAQLDFYRELERRGQGAGSTLPAPAPPKPAAKAAAPGGQDAPAQAGAQPPAAGPPQSPPSAASEAQPGGFAVQVASFKEEGQAKELAARLAGQGLTAYVVPARLPQVGLRYRVRVGPFAAKAPAEEAAARIRSQHKLAAYVTRRD